MASQDRPLPIIDDENRPYWEACKRHELVVQTCSDCGRKRFPPRPMCPYCNSFRSEWPKVSGRGRIFSWMVAHPPILPCFQDKAPLAAVLVELEEGTRMAGNIVDVKPEDIEMDMPVEVVFEDVNEEITLPNFKRAR